MCVYEIVGIEKDERVPGMTRRKRERKGEIDDSRKRERESEGGE